MKKNVRWLIAAAAIVIILVIGWQLILKDRLTRESESYFETFDEPGTWTVGEDPDASGFVRNGFYEMTVKNYGDIFWVTAGQEFTDGTFVVDAVPLEGSIDNGYGMIIRVNEDEGAFYVFKISSDGYAFIGRCEEFCLESEVFESKEWFSAPVIAQGLNVTNTLQVSAAGPEMTFFVNDVQVGQISDDALKRGDIGLIAESFAPGGVRIRFDNFSVTPIEAD